MSKGQFLDAYQNWYATAEKFVRFGACDTEPRNEFAQIIGDMADGYPPVVPTTAAGWQLYSGMPGVEEAAQALTEAARGAVAAGIADEYGLLKVAHANNWCNF